MEKWKLELYKTIWRDWLWGVINNYAKTRSKIKDWDETDQKTYNQIEYILMTYKGE